MIIVYNIQALSGCSADGSVLGSGPRGRGFKSRHSDHLLKVLFINENVDKKGFFLVFSFSNPLNFTANYL